MRSLFENVPEEVAGGGNDDPVSLNLDPISADQGDISEVSVLPHFLCWAELAWKVVSAQHQHFLSHDALMTAALKTNTNHICSVPKAKIRV